MSKSTEKVKKKYADTYKWTDDEVELLLTVTNLVPRGFPLKVGGAGKGPGIGWSRVHLTP